MDSGLFMQFARLGRTFLTGMPGDGGIWMKCLCIRQRHDKIFDAAVFWLQFIHFCSGVIGFASIGR